MLSSYEAVVFDLDNTLTDTKRYPIRASRWFLNQLGIDDESTLEEYLRVLIPAYFRGVQSIAEGAPYRSPREIVHSAIATTAKSIRLDPDPQLVIQTTDLFQQLHLEVSELKPDADLLLTQLKQIGIRLGVITNSFEGHLRLILERLGVIDKFSALVDPGDVKAYKPMASPFEETLKRLNSQIHSTLYIGDEYYADVMGAKRLGIDVVWINNRGQSLEDNILRYGEATRPDLVLGEVNELLKYL